MQSKPHDGGGLAHSVWSVIVPAADNVNTGGALQFFSTRDLSKDSAELREALRRDDVVLAEDGKPFALVVPVEEDEFEATLALVSRVRMERAVERLRRQARASGASGMAEEEIGAEILAARGERRNRS
jgi:antitoxin (DNA-binding transcriptional repressor) of toxin-antitoxin stability system